MPSVTSVQPDFIDPMNGTITLTLLDLRFFAHHGWYEEETRMGQTFLVNAWISYPEPPAAIIRLTDTIDYTAIHSILVAQMNQPRKLLEELAQSTLTEIQSRFPQVRQIRLQIEKVSPPVAGFNGRLGITLERSF
jgi:dihydroneopterin aldolase